MRLAMASGLGLVLACAPRRDPITPDQVRIDRVLTGLRPGLIIRGEPPATWTLAERMARHRVPGVSIAVVDSGRMVWAQGFGVRKAGGADSIDAETVFQAGSISKPVFALGVMRLVQDRRVTLDENVNDRLTTWKVPDNRFTSAEKVTLRRILSHTAGLTVHGFPGYPDGAALPTIIQVLDGQPPANTAAIRVDTVPGTITRYSGGGTTVAMVLAGDVTGRPFAEWMRETVLAPAGMTRSSYRQPLSAALAANAASGHSSAGAVVPGRWFTYPEMAAAGLWTTPSDLVRLGLELQQTWTGRSARIIDQNTFREMLTIPPPGTAPDDEAFALGWHVAGAGAALEFSHSGADEGFRAVFVAFASRAQAAVVMTNGDAGDLLIDETLASIAAEYGWPSHHPREKVTVAIDSARAAGLVGEFALEAGMPKPLPARVSYTAGRLMLEVPVSSIGVVELLADSDSTFFTRGSAIPVRFRRDARGRAVAIVVDGSITGPRK